MSNLRCSSYFSALVTDAVQRSAPGRVVVLVSGLAAFVGFVAPAHAALQFESARTLAYAFDSSVGEDGSLTLQDATRSETQVGASQAEFDFASGVGRLYAEAPAGSGLREGFATLGFGFSLRNTGDAPITFDAGAVVVDVDAASFYALGSGIEGFLVQTDSSFSLGGSVTPGGSSPFGTQYFGSPLTPTPTFIQTTRAPLGNGVRDVRLASPDGVDLTLSFGDFVIAPDGRADFSFVFQGRARAGDGSFAVVDARSSVALRMTLPEGTTLVSGVPLAWVTAVPEPSTGVLWASGVVLLLAGRRVTRARATLA